MTSQKKELKKDAITDEKLKAATDKMGEIADDLAALLREGRTIRTVKGEDITVPGLTGTSEKGAIKTIIKYLRDHSDILKKVFGDDKDMGIEDILGFIIEVAEDGYEAVQELAAHLLGKSIEWVDQHLLVADLIAVIAPFTKAEVSPIAHSIKKHLTVEHLGRKMETKLAEIKAMAMKNQSGVSTPSSPPSPEVPTTPTK